MPLDVGKLGYPGAQPASPGPSIFEQAAEAQVRVDKRHEEAEDSMMSTAWGPDSYKDEELIYKRNNFLADPFHCNPDEYHPK